MDLVTLITLKLMAQQVGSDRFGNRYYQERRARPGKPPRRYVRYKGIAEASKVPADWHGWLHHTQSSPPPEGGYEKYEWQREHQPNLTGTQNAYSPQGHILKGGKRKAATGDYEPWNPA
jgi:NADH:ubiquinone oxidoreductase subunit